VPWLASPPLFPGGPQAACILQCCCCCGNAAGCLRRDNGGPCLSSEGGRYLCVDSVNLANCVLDILGNTLMQGNTVVGLCVWYSDFGISLTWLTYIGNPAVDSNNNNNNNKRQKLTVWLALFQSTYCYRG
jgi:hypothetical protein